MGGINCPPPADGTSNIVAYKQDLASYCKPFFEGMAAFWRGHALIEQAVVIGDSTFPGVASTFSDSQQMFAEARSRFGVFIAMHKTEVDADMFIDGLSKVIDTVEKAILELSLISADHCDGQDGIWESGVTDAMVAAAGAISRVATMQAEFALAAKRHLAFTAF